MKTLTSNVLDIEKGIIVHGCNCEGGFGSGIAGQIASRFPKVADAYHSIKWPDHSKLGQAQAVEITPDKFIVNGFTQKTFGGAPGVKYAYADAIKEVLTIVAKYATASKAAGSELPIHLPLIGAGLGGLDWETEVKPAYEEVENTFLKPHGMELNVHFFTPPVVKSRRFMLGSR